MALSFALPDELSLRVCLVASMGMNRFVSQLALRLSRCTAGPERRVLVTLHTMAGAVAVSVGKPGKRYNAKMTGYVWFLCLICGSGGLLL